MHFEKTTTSRIVSPIHFALTDFRENLNTKREWVSVSLWILGFFGGRGYTYYAHGDLLLWQWHRF